MKPYEKYKDSGVAWIGKVPEHWEVKRGDSIFVLSKNIAKQTGLNRQQIFHYSIPVIQETGTGAIEDGDTVDSDKFILEGNEILFSKLNPRKGTVVISQKHELLTIASTEFVILKPKKDDIKFLFYFLKSNGFQDSVCSVVQSATRSHQRANPVDIYKNKILLPSLPEQTAIAHYLDQKTGEIDQLIAQKERLLALWEEEKTVLINQAVTRGLDAGAKMKDSGVAWLGEVPESWDVKRLKHLSKLISKGTTPSTIGKEITVSGAVRFLKAENIDGNRVVSEPFNFIDNETNELLKRSQLEKDDLLFVIAGATIGKVAMMPADSLPANTNQAVSFIRLKRPEQSKFIWYWLQSDKINKLLWLEAVQSAQPNLSMENLGNFFVPFPPLPEQAAIVHYIETQTARIQQQMDQTRKLIELLQAYRATLICEVVTGKVKITN